MHICISRFSAVLLLARVHDLADTRDRDARLAHLGNDAAKASDWPHEHRIVRHKSDIVADRDRPAHREQRADDHDRQRLQAGDEIAGAPERAHEERQLAARLRLHFILRLEALPLVHLAAERADDADAGEVLLRDRGQPALLLVDDEEASADLPMEEKRIRNDYGYKRRRVERQPAADPGHEVDREREQEARSRKSGQLLREEPAQRLHVRGAALDDVAGVVFRVPGERQPLDVPEHVVPDRLHESLGAFRVEYAEQIAEDGAQNRQQRHDQGQRPDVLPEIGRAAHILVEGLQCARQVHFLAADDAVHGEADHLRPEQVKDGRQRRKQDAAGEKCFAPAQEIKQHRPVVGELLSVSALLRPDVRLARFALF